MEAESEQISDDFTCPVCLDVLYKPIVLVCGHVSCFWCCQHSMRMSSESHCPLCRHPYHHFPAICHTLHFLLKKLYPISYSRRNIQTLEDEKHSTMGFSFDIDNLVSDVGSSSKSKKLKESCSKTYKQISVSDVLCAACKELLFRPVALNCGHVYCESCITIPAEGMLMCQVCECRHPSGFPKVCRELDRFLEDQFSSEYALKRSIIQQNQERNQKLSIQSPSLSFSTKEDFLRWLTNHGSKFHDGVGCDMCGMCPIFGDRYRCKDCTEKCGYDLCGDCYKTGSKLPGRFNQKHTPTHHLELVKPVKNRNLLYRILSGHRQMVSSVVARSESSHPPLEEESGSSSSASSDIDQSDNQPLI